MLETSRAIVLQTIKYGESSVIVQCYTEKYGRQSLMVRGVRKSAKRRNHSMAHLQVFSLLDVTAQFNRAKGMPTVRSMAPAVHLVHVPFDIRKQSMAYFLAEVLLKVLREEAPNQALFLFLFHAIQVIDMAEEQVANVPLMFLTQLSKHLGFQPEANYARSRPYFDLAKGRFVSGIPAHPKFLNLAYSEHMSQLLVLDFSQYEQLPLKREQRRVLLNAWLDYYRAHLHQFGELKTLGVMDELFA